ncbi:protein disulfide oxidoreductase [Vibrio sp. EA2]|uniref:protein disulfide oxidoreductase n=1 Tax=Vibrio sp. EA2 TaxID=3079860 RepID=UPI00294A6C6B|nr:protein disulfide oxidoreductase [Vibrio sp. EA2]MDV6251779.1 protein disulfide oxidoreductase [Vibrio sp. EA2]
MNLKRPRQSWKHWLIQFLQIVLVVTVVAVGMDWYRTKDIPKHNPPALSAFIGNGRYVDAIEKSHKEPVVVYFWATWCPACKFVSPSVNWLSENYSVIGVSGSSGNNERVEQFMRSKGYQFDNINDPKSQIMKAWQVGVTPTIYIIKDGEIASITTGISTPVGILARIWLAS